MGAAIDDLGVHREAAAPSVATLRARALRAFAQDDPGLKSRDTRQIFAIILDNDLDTAWRATTPTQPGRPARPQLAQPRELAHRSLASPQGRATLIHAIVHIEFNAINLALDAIFRFEETPDAFVLDWAKVASEEALHFQLLCEHLLALGYEYGDFPAHNGLWEMAEKTKHDLLARLALVPRTLEARGLDVSPAMRDKLAQAGDRRAAEILDLILRDEIGHVAIGNKWFRYYCDERGLDPIATFDRLSREFDVSLPRAPFNVDARLKAGFEQEEIDWLIAKSQQTKIR
jgi:uncharacterized ferritin-like protein (DUF455 family)